MAKLLIENPAKTRVQRGKAKLGKMVLEALLRRRAEHFGILGAIAKLVPPSADIDGQATGALNERELRADAGVSGKAVTGHSSIGCAGACCGSA